MRGVGGVMTASVVDSRVGGFPCLRQVERRPGAGTRMPAGAGDTAGMDGRNG